MEVVTIEREEWRSVETSSGEECVMMGGMKMTLLWYAGNWDYQKKVYKHCIMLITCLINMHEQHYAGAKAITESDSQSSTGVVHPFFCSG